jgi:hypothetical protein
MSLTSYRAAPPRVNRCMTFRKTGPEAKAANAFLAPIGPVQRLPEKATRARPWGARGMYQRKPALERPMLRFLRFL